MTTPQDLSSDAIRRAVIGRSVQHPAVVYPAVLGLLGGLGVALVSGSPLLIGASVVAGGTAVAALAANFFLRHDRIAGDYLKGVRERLAQERQAHIADLGEDLKQVAASEATRQLERLVDKMSVFHAVLGERLAATELTFARFSAIAEAVFLSAVDNLRDVHLAAKSLQAVDEDYLRQRLGQLGARDDTDGEAKGLRDQLEHARLLRERMKSRLGQNERAMAELDRATAAVGDMKTGSGRPTLDMETAMQELARIAQRSASY